MIDSGVSIHPTLPLWVITAVVVALLTFMVWKEWQRKIKYRNARIAAVVLIIFSILGLFLQPVMEREIESNGVVLLTANYNTFVADSLLKVNPKLILLRTVNASPYRDAAVLDSFDDLYRNPDIHFILGDGLPEYMVREIKNSFQFYQGELPLGIVTWLPPSNFKPNQVQEIHGTFRSNGGSKIKLIGPGGVEDSVSFTQPGTHNFTLSLTPKQSGLFLYAVVTEDEGNSLIQKFPVEVKEENKLNILFVQHYPTAETRYLKNFLTENGHALAVRSKISKDKFHYEYANRQSLSIHRLSPEVLDEFDLFFIDQESLDALTNHEKVVLEESVKQGLGLLIFYHSKDKIKGSDFLSLSRKDNKGDTVRLNLRSSTYTFTTLPLTMIDRVEPVTQVKDRVLSGYVNKGGGRVAFQLLQETYRLLLESKKMEYASLWSPLVERAARSQHPKFKIELDQPFPIFPDEPMDVHVIAADETPRLKDDDVLIPLREDVVIDDYWHGTTWAGQPGWHKFTIGQDSVFKNYYVSNPAEWQSLRIAQQQKANEAISRKTERTQDFSKIIKEHKPMNLLLFYMIFLLAAGFLWLAPKL